MLHQLMPIGAIRFERNPHYAWLGKGAHHPNQAFQARLMLARRLAIEEQLWSDKCSTVY